MKTNYTSRTLKYLREEKGFYADIAERFINGAFIRKDLFNIIDIVAISDTETWGVQSTSYQQRKKHLDDLRENKLLELYKWCKAGRRYFFVTWKKQKLVRGGTAFKFVPIIDEFNEKGEIIGQGIIGNL